MGPDQLSISPAPPMRKPITSCATMPPLSFCLRSLSRRRPGQSQALSRVSRIGQVLAP